MVITLYLAILFCLNQAWSAETIEHEVEKPNQLSGLVSLDYVSWQQQASIKTPASKSRIIITNQGLCAGGAVGYKHVTYRTFMDACFLYGEGNSGAVKNSITYNQSNISAYGAKASFGAGRFVSAAKAEIGFKIPLMYVHQTLTEPNNTSLTEAQSFMLMGSLYSRWPFEKWFVQTEFSKFVGNDLVLFSVGGGHEF